MDMDKVYLIIGIILTIAFVLSEVIKNGVDGVLYGVLFPIVVFFWPLVILFVVVLLSVNKDTKEKVKNNLLGYLKHC